MKKTSLLKYVSIAFALATFVIHSNTDAFAQGTYDERLRSEFSLPPDFFFCEKTDDCTLVSIPCSPSLAVSRAHLLGAQLKICGEAGGCLSGPPACTNVLEDTSRAVCDNRQCITLLR